MIVYQVCCEEYFLDGKCDVKRCECYKNERDAALFCAKYNDNITDDAKWYYEPLEVYEGLDEAVYYSNLFVKWRASFVDDKIISVDRMGFVVDTMDNWEVEEDNSNRNGHCVVLRIRAEEGDEDNIFKIAKKAYAEYTEGNNRNEYKR